MMRFLNQVLPVLLCMILGACRTDCQEGWVKLFNGKDLEGWDTYLRSVDMLGYEIDPTYPYQPPIGLNNDPLDVFTVQDGVIRISGVVWGAIKIGRASVGKEWRSGCW